MLGALRLAFGLLTVLPVGLPDLDRRVAGRAMLVAPAVGAALGLAGGGVGWVAYRAGLGSLTASVLAVAALAALTRGLHLDGLADTADGLGSGRDRVRALGVMRASDIGPFGVVTVLFVVLVQVTALSEAFAAGHGPLALILASATGRLTFGWACRTGVPPARPDGLGALVAGTVPTVGAVLCTAVVLGLAVGAGAVDPLGDLGPVYAGAMVLAGLGAGLVLCAHVRRRLGGITGDVLGALAEVAVATALVVAAAG